MKLGRETKLEIELHELFFSSFFEKNMKAKLPFYNNSSQAGFLYEAEREAVLGDGLFLIICKSNKGVICKSLIRTYAEFPESKPLLCIDLCEHSYFSDYSFDKRRYVREALLHLNFNKMN